MLSLRVESLTVQFDQDGDRHFDKSGVINWLGRPVQIVFGSHTFHFDLEGRIQRIDGLAAPHSWDWLQRTMANDWIYYDKAWVPGTLPQAPEIIGDAVWAVNGRSDLPILDGHRGMQRDYAVAALQAFDDLIVVLQDMVIRRPAVNACPGPTAGAADVDRLWSFLCKAAANDRAQLQRIADTLHDIHGHMAVLPPDTIHVDYRVLLLKVMDGCPNACGFCIARGDADFAIRDTADIDRQIDAVARIYGADLYHYNSVVFGECDALVSPWIAHAARRAFDAFQCGASFHGGSNLFLFATNKTLCQLPGSTFDMLDALSFEHVWINVGWEAATDAALAQLGKRQTAHEVLAGMRRAGEINRTYSRITVSGNFIAADDFDCASIVEAIAQTAYAGQLYLSPLRGKCSTSRALADLRAIRHAHRGVRVHLYTMQRM